MKIRAVDFAAHSDAEIATFLEGCDAEQLNRIENAIKAVNELKAEQKRQEMRDEIAAIEAKFGCKVGEAFGSIKGNAKVAPKYRNPANASDTWTGRGRRPAWVQAFADAHNDDLTGLLIEAPATVE